MHAGTMSDSTSGIDGHGAKVKTNHLKKLWREGGSALGMWACLGSTASVEAMASMDLDFILIDGEHGVASYEGAFPLLQAMNGSKTTSIIRVPGIDHIAIKRSLDMGAEGILVPYVRNADEVRHVVSECRYPPKGIRGIGPYRASMYELDFMDYFTRAEKEIAVIIQIETTDAVENLDEIIAVEGVDALFIGPADLSGCMGRFPDMNHPEVQEVVARILQKGNAAGLPVGYFCSNGMDAHRRVEQGFRMVNIGNDMVFLTRGVVDNLKTARSGKAADSGPLQSFT